MARKTKEEEIFDAFQRGQADVKSHMEPSPETRKFIEKTGIILAEVSKDIKSILEKLEENKEEHKELKAGQAYTNGKVRSLFIWKATIIGMGIIITLISTYVVNDYLQTKEKMDDIDKRLSTVEGYFEKTNK